MATPVTKVAASPSESDPWGSLLQAFQALSPTFLGSGTTTNTETDNSSVDPQMAAILQSILGQSNSDVASGDYSKQAAINDSTGQIQQIIQQGLTKNMPTISAGAHGAGLYNDTTTKLLSDNLQAQLAGQANDAIQKNIANYANIQNQATANTINAAKALGTTNTSTKTSTTAPTVAPGAAASGAAGIAGVAALSKLLGGTGIGKKVKNIFGDDASSAATDASATGGGLQAGFGGGDTGGLDSGTGFGSSFDSSDSPVSDVVIGDTSGADASGASFGDDYEGGGSNFFDSLFGGSGSDTTGSLADIGSDAASDIVGGLGDTGADVAADAASSLGSSLGDVPDVSDAVDLGEDGSGFLGDIFDGWFANGGRVPSTSDIAKQMVAQSNSGSNSGTKSSKKKVAGKTHFADGGRVSPSNIYDPNQLSAAATKQAALNTPMSAVSGSGDSGNIMLKQNAPVVQKPSVQQSSNTSNNSVTTPTAGAARPDGTITGTEGTAKGPSGDLSNGVLSDTSELIPDFTREEDFPYVSYGGDDSNNTFGTMLGIAQAVAKIAMGNPVGGALDAISAAITGKSLTSNIFSGIQAAIKNPGGIATPVATGLGAQDYDSGIGNGVSGGDSTGTSDGMDALPGSGNTGGDTGADTGLDDGSDDGLNSLPGSGNSGGDEGADDSSPPAWNDTSVSPQDRANYYTGGDLNAWYAYTRDIVSGEDSSGFNGNGHGGNGGAYYISDSPGLSSGSGSSYDSGGGSGDFTDPNNGNDNSTDSGISFRNGGTTPTPSGKMPGHDTKGKDKINIHVSGGEFVVPTDVVDHLGVDYFNRLVKQFHHPIGGK